MPSYEEYMNASQKGSSLYYLAKAGDVAAIVSLLKEDQHDINAKDFKGYSPLMYAAYHGHLEVVRYLISKGADVNSADQNGNSILMGVSFKGHEEIVQLLVESGANIKAQNIHRQTALDFANLFGRRKVARILSGRSVSYSHSILKSLSSWGKFLKLRPNKSTLTGEK